MCNLLVIEVGFCRDLGCHEKIQEKTEKYNPLLHALQNQWGDVAFVYIPIGHAGTTMSTTREDIAKVLAVPNPSSA
jgi:hypothetical protein